MGNGRIALRLGSVSEDGKMEEWKSEELQRWKNGMMEEWKNGKMEREEGWI